MFHFDSSSKAIRVCCYLDALGLLVDLGLVDRKAVTALLGGAIKRHWETLDPFIEAERDKRGEKYPRSSASAQAGDAADRCEGGQ